MNRIKRIVALLLCIFIFCGPASVFAEPVKYMPSDKQMMALKAVGIEYDESTFDNKLTRSEFAGMINTLLTKDGANPFLAEDAVFSDIDEYSVDYDPARALVEIGAMQSGEAFRPDDAITRNEAVDIAVKTLQKVALANDGYVNANNAKRHVESNLTSYDANNLTVSSGLIIISNLLSYDEIWKLRSDLSEKENFLEGYRHIKSIKGIVTDDGYISTYGEGKIRKEHIKIGDTELINSSGAEGLFGYEVYGFYEHKTPEDSMTLLSVMITSKNTLLKLYSDNIISYDNGTYVYTPDEFGTTKSKVINLKNDILTVYNGKSLTLSDTDFTKEKYVPKTGTVSFLDNDNDGLYDILFIEDYQTYMVNATGEDIIYLKDNPVLDVEKKDYVIMTKEFEKTSIDTLSENTVISVAKSLDGEKFKILTSTDTAVDTVIKHSPEESYVITELGAKYKLSEYFYENMAFELGCEYTFYFDAFGKAVYAVKFLSDEKAGYFIKSYEDDDNEIYFIRVIDENATAQVFELAKNVKLYNDDDTEFTYEAEKAFDFLSEKGYTGIIEYKLNAYGKVSSIELPLGWGIEPKRADRLCVIGKTSTSENAWNYYKNMVTSLSGTNYYNFGALAMGNADTVCYNVPLDESNYSLYDVIPINKIQTGTGAVQFIVYSKDYKSNVADLAVVQDAQRGGGVILSISDINRVYDEDEGFSVYKVTGMTTNTAVEYKVIDDKIIEEAGAMVDDTVKNKVGKGDVVYAILKQGKISDLKLIYDADGELNGKKGCLAGTTIDYFDMSYDIKTANPYALDSNFELTTNYRGAYRYNVGYYRVCLGYVYSFENDKFITMTTQDLEREAYMPELLAQKNGYYNYTYYYTNTISVITNDKNVTTSAIKTTDIKPYTIYGSDCSKFLTIRVDNGTSYYVLINDEG